MEKIIEEHNAQISDLIKKISKKEIESQKGKWDEKQIFPEALFAKLGELGLMGVIVPEKYGGSGFGYYEYVHAVIELSKIDASIGLSVAAHNSLCTNHIVECGSEEQKKKYLPNLASGKWIGAWALTEASTGSDAATLKTVAIREGNEWVIDGSKMFITHGNSSDVMIVIARTGELGASSNASAFIVERNTKGLIKGEKQNKLGMRASETTEVYFENCRVPYENLIGNVGEGFKQALKILDGGRISIAALACGIAEGALETALAYSKEREQFGKKIAEFQGISFKLADSYTKLNAAKLLTFRAADMKNRGLKVNKESAMAKLYSSEVAVEIANEGVQILGGYGYTKDFMAEKYYRDAKLCTIGEGTSEIQKIVISKNILKS